MKKNMKEKKEFTQSNHFLSYTEKNLLKYVREQIYQVSNRVHRSEVRTFFSFI